MKKIILTLALAAGAAGANDAVENQVRNDRDYGAKVQQARQILAGRGYRVLKIEADDYRGRPALDVDAVKGQREYDIKLSYPDLRIIYERIDD